MGHNGNAPPPLNVVIPEQGGSSAGSKDNPYGLGEYGKKAIPHSASLVNGVVPKGKKGTLTANQVLDYFHTLQKTNPDQAASLQMLLYRGGFYAKNAKFLPGVIRKTDEDALKSALKSVSAGDNFAAYLGRAAQMGDELGINATAEQGRMPHVTQLTSSTDVQSVAESIAPQVIGRKLAPGEVAQIVSGYHALESRAQAAAYNESEASGTSYTAPPDLGAYVKERTRALHPQEAVATDRATVADSFLKIVNSGAPNTAEF